MISVRRNEPFMVRWRSRLYLAAAASNGSPSWNFTPGRSFMVTVLPSAEVSRAERELRHDVALLVDVEQLVADRREHDTRRIKARQRRIQDVAVVAQPDAQRAPGRRRRRRPRTPARQRASARTARRAVCSHRLSLKPAALPARQATLAGPAVARAVPSPGMTGSPLFRKGMVIAIESISTQEMGVFHGRGRSPNSSSRWRRPAG